uniref:Uncharacterized protein n=1 Tax=Vibrio coralliilyticus TaxID=190893 RepID=M1FXD7_9VIBR|nr:hypothetical protein [Vibrio coralliilyticus]
MKPYDQFGTDRGDMTGSVTGGGVVVAIHRIGAWRIDHRRLRTVIGNGAIGRLTVVGTIGRELANRRVDLILSRRHLRIVTGILIGHDMCDDVSAISIERQVQFAPTLAEFGTMLFLWPLPRAVDLQTGAVYEDVHGSVLRDAITWELVRRSRLDCPTAQGRMIGNGKAQPRQLQHRRSQTLRLTQPQAEYQAQHQGRLDRKIGIARLATACCPLRRLPGRQCLWRHPEREAPTLTKARLVFRPVRDFELHLPDMMAAGGIVHKQHLLRSRHFQLLLQARGRLHQFVELGKYCHLLRAQEGRSGDPCICLKYISGLCYILTMH